MHTMKPWNHEFDFDSDTDFSTWKHEIIPFLLILYFRMLDDISKTASLFSRPCSIALWSPWLFFCFPPIFLHSSDITRWVDQNFHVSHLYLIKSILVDIFMWYCKPPGSSLAVIPWTFFVTSPCNIHKQRSEFQISNVHHWLLDT